VAILAIGFGYQTINCQAITQDSHATFGDTGLGGQVPNAARAVTQSVEDAQIDARLQRGATLVRGECLPNELGIRFRQRQRGCRVRECLRIDCSALFSSMTRWEMVAFSDILLPFLCSFNRE
jgi:hypothetical protein